MDEKLKRSTRDRKPPKYFSIDVSMGRTQSLVVDNFGYVAPTNSKDIQTPTADLNSNGKILVKFLQQVNKGSHLADLALRDHQFKEEVEQKQRIISESGQNGYQSLRAPHSYEPTKKQLNGRKDHREESSNRNKEFYPFRDQRERPEVAGPHAKHDQPPKSRAITKNSARASSTPASHTLEMSSIIQQLKAGKIPVNFPILMNRNDISERQRKAFYDALTQHNLVQDENLREKLRFNSMEEREDKKNKLFGRSAYHIAIAYHIHLEKVKHNQDQSRNISELDPTYNSKQLKEKTKDTLDYK